mgnify:FL=1
MRENHENQVVSAIVWKNPKFVTLEDLCVEGMLRNRHLWLICLKTKKIPVAHGELTPLECDTKR